MSASTRSRGQATALPPGKPREFSVNGTTLFAEEFGSSTGLPALVLPGGPGCSHEYMNPVGAGLADRVHSFVLDTRGSGRSGRPAPETMTHENIVDDYDAVREELGLEKWMLVGHSYGGFLSLEYALRYPQRVSRLVLIGSGSAMDMGHIVAENANRLAKKYPKAYQAFTNGAYDGKDADERYNHHMQTVIPLFFKEFDETVAAPLFASRFSAHGDHQWGHDLAGYDITDRLNEIRCPTLVIDGRHDFILPVEQQERLHEGIAGSELVLLDSSGHFPFLEDPPAFDVAVRGWLDGKQP